MNIQAIPDWQVNKVAASFTRAATRYDKAARLQRTTGSMLFEKLGNDLKSGQSILDIGAGTGFCTQRLASSGAQVIALDIAPSMLVQARLRVGAGASYIRADTQSIALQANTVDLIFANLALQWCVDLGAVFREFRRVLDDAGQILFSAPGPDTLCELRKAWQEVDQYRHVNDFFDSDYLQQQLENAGFGGNIETRVIQLEYSSPMQLMQEIKTIGAVNMSAQRLRGLTGKQRLQRVCEEYDRLMEYSITKATWEIMIGEYRCVN
ncbi:MAG TPA: malonyl-[acyl-carrier protein] O-methyltransferase BioC [Crenotrichaceae bacterium]|nr:malonyl-[acyl-carrier protein] O-methyltransferase BioC [Crenotrichaceae bacterium]